VVLDNPPVNALSRELRQTLIDRITLLSADEHVQAIVLVGANGIFIGGADLREFDQPSSDPILPEVIAVIEDCPKPVIAAIQGAAFGGGYEVALACDGRVAIQEAIVGLPEGTFGIIPGAGGTVRLPRLTDAATALEIIASCRSIPALEAKRLGLIDAIVKDLRADAAAFGLSLKGKKRRLRDLPAKNAKFETFEKAAQAALRRGRNRPYAMEQVIAVRRAFTQPFDQALAAERVAFDRLRSSDESAALRYLFFAERKARRVDGVAGMTPLPIRSVGIVGAGTMGSGITAAFLAAGIPVTLVDSKAEALTAARERIQSFLARVAGPAMLSPTECPEALSGCDLVLEAVFESLTIKQDLLRKLDSIVRPDAIVASNTSYLDLDFIASAQKRPERVVGLHFFAPAHIMRLLEVVRGTKTAPQVLATALKLGRVLGKIPVVSGVGEGFIGNRIYNAYRTQCETMLLDSALPHEIDSALEEFGFAMGPFAVSDLSGLDIAWANRRRKQDETGDRTSDLPVLEWLVESGRLGRKTGAGWYRYDQTGKRAADERVTSMIRRVRASRRTDAQALTKSRIQRRAMAAIINEALLVLADGIAQCASDIDLVLVHGYGFPRHLGGPLYWARRQDQSALGCDLDYVSNANGSRRRGDLSLLSGI
jgi:3-hydroxyacyl-CoA dehydrogenase